MDFKSAHKNAKHCSFNQISISIIRKLPLQCHEIWDTRYNTVIYFYNHKLDQN